MKYKIVRIEAGSSYGFTIGIPELPDSKLKERIVADIDAAMGSFKRSKSARHSVAVVYDGGTPEGSESEPFQLDDRHDSQYLIFAILETGNLAAGSITDRVLEDTRSAVGDMLQNLVAGYERKPKIALVLLQDAMVTVLPLTPVPRAGVVAQRAVKGWN